MKKPQTKEKDKVFEKARLLDFVLLLQNCKTKGDVADILKEIETKSFNQGKLSQIEDEIKFLENELYNNNGFIPDEWDNIHKRIKQLNKEKESLK
jgi:hypothetical protein